MTPFETIEIGEMVAACNGGGGPLGHPRVYLNLAPAGWIECPYCSRRFVNRAVAQAGGVAPGGRRRDAVGARARAASARARARRRARSGAVAGDAQETAMNDVSAAALAERPAAAPTRRHRRRRTTSF